MNKTDMSKTDMKAKTKRILTHEEIGELNSSGDFRDDDVTVVIRWQVEDETVSATGSTSATPAVR